jgi:hypothetical protein
MAFTGAKSKRERRRKRGDMDSRNYELEWNRNMNWRETSMGLIIRDIYIPNIRVS